MAPNAVIGAKIRQQVLHMIYDITRRVTSTTAVWPGDRPYQVDFAMRRDAGDFANLTSITLSPHTGSHADAYFHYEIAGAHPADMPLTAYIGKARVVTVAKQDGPLIVDDFAPAIFDGAERLLLHSSVSDFEDDQWPTTFPYLSLSLIEHMAAKSIVLIGLDSPSVDPLDSTDLPCHHALYQHGLVNLECLRLRDVPDGDYELIALPLKLDETCGSPVRAILRAL